MDYRWYAIQTTAGHENKVRTLLSRRIDDDPRPAEEKLVRQALVPVQDVVEIKNGKKVTVERKLYPGYVLVEMQMTQEALHLVNGVQGVIKFVAAGRMPQPLRQDEVNRLAAAGITKGCNPPTNDEYCPDEKLTRAQMATFLVRSFGLAAGAGSDRFVDDDGNIHEDAIDALAASDITRGCNPPTNDRFCPDQPITRGQMAAFIYRMAQLPGDD